MNIIFPIISFFFFLVSCTGTNSYNIENIDSQSLHKLILTQEGIIIDVRTSEEFLSGHLNEATNIDFYSNDFIEKLKLLRKDLPVYVYCRSGGRSTSASNQMQKLGFTKIYNLIGGIESWKLANYPVIKSNKTHQSNHPFFSIAELDDILFNNKLVLINFSTEWCVPCKKMKPIIEKIQKENKNLEVVFIDADVNRELVEKYQIQGVPVFVIFNNGQEIFRHIGIISEKKLLNELI